VGQAKAFAGKLQLRFTYASKGLGLYAINMATGTGKTSIAFLIIWMLFAALVEIRRVAQEHGIDPLPGGEGLENLLNP
jgi:hypothetical protein